ncbi:MAG: ribonuclease HI family protein [Patescibacteria group bacterium]|jgi:ribonuclease HI
MIPIMATVWTDGGARGNPGPAAIGYVMEIEGQTVASVGECIGEATNNVAEYTALLRALNAAKAKDATMVHCFLDSLLVVEQLNRRYKVKDANLAKLFTQVWNQCQQFQKVTFQHIPREQNKRADALVNAALDGKL